jgi:hypothetical protein
MKYSLSERGLKVPVGVADDRHFIASADPRHTLCTRILVVGVAVHGDTWCKPASILKTCIPRKP